MNKRKIPLRQCIGCQEMKEKKQMIRILKTPEDTITMDATGKKNGRGAYICSNSTCLSQAIQNKGLERSLKTSIPNDVYEALKEELGRLHGDK